MPIRIGTSERDGTFNSQGKALKTIFERRPSLGPVEVLESNSASIENANRLHAGEIEFGFMASNWIGRAKNGEAPFRQPIDIRMVAPMNAGPLFFVARAGEGSGEVPPPHPPPLAGEGREGVAPLRTVADLRGRRLAVGMQASGMVQHAHTIFGVLGMRFSDFTPVYLDFAAGADALAAGEVDAQFQCPIPNKVMTALAERTAVRVLPYAPADLDALLKAVPYYRATVMRKGSFRGLDADVPQVAVVNVLATHARMADAVVRDAAAAIVLGSSELGQLNPLFAGLADLFEPLRTQGAAALEFGGVALHPGARAAYREAGLLP